MKNVFLSIIIVNCDTADLTLSCIRSIYQYSPTCSYEIILVDNSLEENIEQQLGGEFPAVRLIRTGKNLGFSKANNLGIYNSHGEYVVLLNSDTKIVDSCFDHMLDYFKKHPTVGAVGPREIDGEGKYRLSCGDFPTFFSELQRKIWHYRLSIDDYKLRDYLDSKHASLDAVDWVSGSCMMICREALYDAGLLDERFFMYFEDIDLCDRIRKKGWEVHYLSNTRIVHYGGLSATTNLMLVLTEYRRSEIYFARKHYGRTGEYGIRFFLFLKYSFHFLRHISTYFFQKIFRKDTSRSYTVALLAKKVIEMVFDSFNAQPLEPVLKKES